MQNTLSFTTFQAPLSLNLAPFTLRISSFEESSEFLSAASRLPKPVFYSITFLALASDLFLKSLRCVGSLIRLIPSFFCCSLIILFWEFLFTVSKIRSHDVPLLIISKGYYYKTEDHYFFLCFHVDLVLKFNFIVWVIHPHFAIFTECFSDPTSLIIVTVLLEKDFRLGFRVN